MEIKVKKIILALAMCLTVCSFTGCGEDSVTPPSASISGDVIRAGLTDVLILPNGAMLTVDGAKVTGSTLAIDYRLGLKADSESHPLADLEVYLNTSTPLDCKTQFKPTKKFGAGEHSITLEYAITPGPISSVTVGVGSSQLIIDGSAVK